MPHKSIKILCEDQCNDTISAGFESGDSSPREEIRYEGVISVSEIRLGTTIKGDSRAEFSETRCACPSK